MAFSLQFSYSDLSTTNKFMASAKTMGFWFSTSNPLCLFLIISLGPASQLTDTTGIPNEKDSGMTIAKPSERLVKTKNLACFTYGNGLLENSLKTTSSFKSNSFEYDLIKLISEPLPKMRSLIWLSLSFEIL